MRAAPLIAQLAQLPVFHGKLQKSPNQSDLFCFQGKHLTIPLKQLPCHVQLPTGKRPQELCQIINPLCTGGVIIIDEDKFSIRPLNYIARYAVPMADILGLLVPPNSFLIRELF